MPADVEICVEQPRIERQSRFPSMDQAGFTFEAAWLKLTDDTITGNDITLQLWRPIYESSSFEVQEWINRMGWPRWHASELAATRRFPKLR